MGSEEYLLQWNDYQTSFSSMVQAICLKDEMTDCTISNGKRTFSVHRLILSICSSYLRNLFNSIPSSQHPVILIDDVTDEIVEMLIGYMYSGQVSVTQQQIVPLLNAAKSLGVKGLLDVPFPDHEAEDVTPSPKKTTTPPPRASQRCGPPPLKKLKPNTPLKMGGSSQKSFCDTNNSINNYRNDDVVVDTENTDNNDTGKIPEEEGVDPLENGHSGPDHELLKQLTNEMTAYSLVTGAGAPLTPSSLDTPPKKGNRIILAEPKRVQVGNMNSGDKSFPMILYSCSHCGKEFSSKRKHQRHVLNVHFRYNPVQCPFCHKGHRDNYNLKQHVCPVINMKYGVYEKQNEGVVDAAAIKAQIVSPGIEEKVGEGSGGGAGMTI